MTRVFWILIALFPLPLVALLVAGPPELFERDRVLAARQVIAALDVTDPDWDAVFAAEGRVPVKRALPKAAGLSGDTDFVLAHRGEPTAPVLIVPTAAGSLLEYRVSEGCWDLPERQVSLLRRC